MIPEIKCIDFNGEKLAFFTFFDHSNRDPEVTEYHQKVTSYFNMPWNYIPIDYKIINHGGAIEYIIKNLSDKIQYFAFFDNDCLPLVNNLHEIIYLKLLDKLTLYGGCQTASHIHKEKEHPFVAPSSFCISADLYKKIGQPHLGDSIKRSDTVEETTFRCQELGYQVCMVYPVSYFPLTEEEIESSGNPKFWTLQKGFDHHIKFGLGTNYGNLFFHAFMQNLRRSKELLISTAKKILEPKTEIFTSKEQEFTYKNIDGWCDFFNIYEEQVNKAKDGDLFVELGVFQGRSAAFMGECIRKSGKKIKFYAIDDFESYKNNPSESQHFQGDLYEKCLENLNKCGVRNHVGVIKGKSADISKKFDDKSIDFLFLDAGHKYEDVINDLKNWYPKLKNNGLISGHDAADYAPGVLRALNEFFGKDGWKRYADIGSSWIKVQKRKIEAIIVCKNYSDYLAITLPQNHKYFDNVFVISEENDIETKRVCDENGAIFIPYDGFNKNGAMFNFGGSRGQGLKHIIYNSYICYLDSDILIKEDFRDKLNDVTKFYGSYRRFIPKIKDYQDLMKGNKKQEEFKAIPGEGCGYFQTVSCEHPTVKALGLNNLYDDSFSAEQVDIDFLRKFCKFENNKYENLVNLNIELWHLGEGDARNNFGRTEKDNFFSV